MKRLSAALPFLVACLLALASRLPAQGADTTVVCTGCVKVDSTITTDSVAVIDTTWAKTTTIHYTYRDSLLITPKPVPPPPPAPTDSGPAGFRLLTLNDFNTGVILAKGWIGQAGYDKQYRVANDPAVSRDGSPYLELLVPAGHALGTGFQNLTFAFNSQGCREVAYSFWFRSTPTGPYGSNVQKLVHWWGPGKDGEIGNIGLTNLYISAGGYNVRAAWQGVETTNLGAGRPGISNQVTGGRFPFNTWVKIEGRLGFNTRDTPASADGFHRITRTTPTGAVAVNAENLFWTDAVPVASRTWRWVDIDPTIPSSPTPAPYTLYFDDFVVACR